LARNALAETKADGFHIAKRADRLSLQIRVSHTNHRVELSDTGGATNSTRSPEIRIDRGPLLTASPSYVHDTRWIPGDNESWRGLYRTGKI